MKLYFESFKMHVKSQLEYRTSFVLGFTSQFVLFFTYYFVIIGLFQKFDNVQGYTVYDVLLCCGIVNFGYALIEMFFRGIDRFEDLIIDGSLDRYMVRPRSILHQALCSKIDLVKSARVLQSIALIVIAIINMNIKWNLLKVITLILMNIGCIYLFFGLFLIMASYTFFTIQGLEIKNLFTDGGKHAAQYPISIYKRGLSFVFTFIIPYSFVNYYPLLYLSGKSDNVMYVFIPLITLIYLIPCFLAFKFGLKHYESTGS